MTESIAIDPHSLVDIKPFQDKLIQAVTDLRQARILADHYPADPSNDDYERAEERVAKAARKFVSKLNSDSIQSYHYWGGGGRCHVMRENQVSHPSGYPLSLCGMAFSSTSAENKTLSVKPSDMPGLCGTCLKSWISQQRKQGIDAP